MEPRRIAPLAALATAVLPTACGEGAAPPPATRVESEFLVRSAEGTGELTLTILLPSDRDDGQRVRQLDVSPTPERIFEEGDNRYAEFRFDPAPPYLTVRVTAQVESGGSGSTGDLTAQQRRRYLSVEPGLEHDRGPILTLAARVHGADDGAKLRSAYRLVCDHMEYAGYVAESPGALAAAASGRGDCTDYADLLVAVCRAAGLPARTVLGLYHHQHSEAHNWVEAWVDGRGWVRVDPLQGDLGVGDAETTPGTYVTLSNLRNDPLTAPWSYYRYACEGGSVEVAWAPRISPAGVSSPLSR